MLPNGEVKRRRHTVAAVISGSTVHIVGFGGRIVSLTAVAATAVMEISEFLLSVFGWHRNHYNPVVAYISCCFLGDTTVIFLISMLMETQARWYWFFVFGVYGVSTHIHFFFEV